MAIPLMAAAAAALAAIYAAVPESIKDITKEEFLRIALGERSEFEKAALSGAFEKFGLTMDGDEPLTPETITRLINEGPLAGTGVELTNLFDKESLKRDFKRLALEYARQALGMDLPGLSQDAIIEYVRGYIFRKIREQVDSGGGDIIARAPEFVTIMRMIEQAKEAGRMDDSGNFVAPDLKMTPEAISNRERQARYRATHKRVWVQR